MATITEKQRHFAGADQGGDNNKSGANQCSFLFDDDGKLTTTATNGETDGIRTGISVQYDVEHLATFSTASENDNGESAATNKSKFKQTNDASSATEPKVALQKLFELEKLSGIWTQRMQIQLQQDVMLILDCETDSIVERFHCDRVSKPEAFNHYNDIYNNIIVFIIDQKQVQPGSSSTNQENCDKPPPPEGELHIFQCVSHKAKQLVTDILDWKRAQSVKNGKENTTVPLSEERKQAVDEQNSLSDAPKSSDQKSQDMRNEAHLASKDRAATEARKTVSRQQTAVDSDDLQRPRPAVTVSSSSDSSETVPIVNVNVKETVQVFNQIAALREKSGGANQTARPLSDASSSSQQTAGAAGLGNAVLSAGGQFYKQRSIRVTLAPKSGSPEEAGVARPASPAHKTTASQQQVQPSSSSSSSINASSSVSSSSRLDNHHQHINDITKKLPTGMVSSVSSSSSSSKDDNHHQNATSQKQIAIQQLQQQSVKTNSNSHTQSSLSNHQHLNQHSHQHNQPPPHQQQQKPPGSGGGGGKSSKSTSVATNKLSSSSSSSSSRPPASNGQHHQHHHGGRSHRVSPPLEQDHHHALEQVNTNESYVSVLNHCFDDIEKFIIRLQHAYAAMRELQAQKKQTRRSSSTTLTVAGNNGQSNKLHAARNGNGGAPLPPPPPPSLTAPELAMLSAQARGPSPDDFFEILSKFKLAFNLLAKLKGCIHEPNAPELVHFLFTPLAIIIESARNVTPPVDPAVVGIPYLNKDALDLLSNCCTSKESDLWLSLGANWTQTIDVQVLKASRLPSSFQPIFSDGWAPVISELELIGLVLPPVTSSPTNNADQQQHYRSMRAPQDGGGPLMIEDSSHGGRKSQLVARNGFRPDHVESSVKSSSSSSGVEQVKSSKKRIAAPKDPNAPIKYMDTPSSYAPGSYHLEPAIVEDPLAMAVGHSAGQYRAPDVGGRHSRSAARMSMPASEKSNRTASSSNYTSIGGPKPRHTDYPGYGHYAPPLAANGSFLGGYPPRPEAALPGSGGGGYSSYATTHPSDDYTELHGVGVGPMPLHYLAGPSSGGGGGYVSGHSRHKDSRGFSGYDRGPSYPLSAQQDVGIYDDDVINGGGADLLASEAEQEAMLLDIGPAQTEWFYELKSRGALIVRVLFTREANNDKELTVRRGEILEILDDTRKWWKARNIDLQVAYVPHTIVAVMEHYQTLDELLINSPGSMMMMINEEPNAAAAARYNYGGGDERHSTTAKGAFRYF